MTPQYPEFALGETAAGVMNQIMDSAFVSGKTKKAPYYEGVFFETLIS
jgi:hypothetical protein